MILSIYLTCNNHTHSLGHMSERGEALLVRERECAAVRRSSYCFGAFTVLVLILSLRKLWGFLLYGFLEENHCVHCLLCLIVVLVILSVKDPNNASLMLKN